VSAARRQRIRRKRNLRLIVGLGNPGPDYERTRHNVGFMAIDEIRKSLGGAEARRKWKARVARVDGLLLAKPETYMNLSGDSVYEIVRNNAIPTEDVLVVLDDLDLPLGKVRVRARGGSAGHKGMQSIIERLRTNEIARVKIGIGRPDDGIEPAECVLRRPSGSDKETLLRAIETGRDVCLAVMREGVAAAMNLYNGAASGDDKS